MKTTPTRFDSHAGQSPEDIPKRTVTRVESKVHLGADSQVDDRYAIIAPTRPAATDPFILLAEDWFSTSGFEWHPHRGLETVTLVVDGVLEYGDNLGNVGALSSGDVQWMTAGRGIIHRELAYRNERAHILQLWVNLPGKLKMADTRYQDLPAATRTPIEREGVRLDLLSGAIGESRGPALNHWPIHGALVTLEPARSYEHVLPAHDRAFLHVLRGVVMVADRPVRAGETAWSEPVARAGASAIRVASRDGAQPSAAVIFSGQPIGEPVVMAGPFVMNSKLDIAQAFTDYRTGKLGDIPRRARLP